MNIDEMKFGELKQIAAMFNGGAVQKTNDPLVGKYVIIRTYSAGVHAGELVEQNGDVVLLKDSRRLWSWSAVEGVALSGVAVSGLKKDCKVDSKVDLIRLTGAIETIICSEAGRESICNY